MVENVSSNSGLGPIKTFDRTITYVNVIVTQTNIINPNGAMPGLLCLNSISLHRGHEFHDQDEHNGTNLKALGC
jgi:hypothetical protein